MVTLRDHRIVFSVQDIVSMYHLRRVHAPQYPFAESIHPSHYEVSRELTNGTFSNMVMLKPRHLAFHYRRLHRIMASVVDHTGHFSDISTTRDDLLYD
ncbi:hypothetical protein U1Q18_017822, partial [Sarracenia purpurea var. burkii]